LIIQFPERAILAQTENLHVPDVAHIPFFCARIHEIWHKTAKNRLFLQGTTACHFVPEIAQSKFSKPFYIMAS